MNRRARASLVTLALLSALLSACGGGGGKGGSLPPTGSNPQAKKIGTAAFTLKIPGSSTMTKLRRRYYQSQATQGVAIDWVSTNPSAPDYSAPITATCPSPAPSAYPPGVTNCVGPTQSADGGTDYTFQLSIPAGTYPNFTVTTFDQAPASGETFTASANMLAQGQLAAPVVITGGTSNTIPNLTFYGIPASVSFVPGPAQSHVTTYSGNIAVIGDAPQTFFAQAVDADGFVIDSTDSGAPTVTVTEAASDSPQEFSIATTATPYEFTLAAKNASGNATIVLNATPGGTGLLPMPPESVTLTPVQEMWAIESAGPVNAIDGFPLYPSNSYNPGSTPLDSANPSFPNCGSPCNWAWSAIAPNGDLWVEGEGTPDALYVFKQGAGSQGLVAPSGAAPVPLGSTPQGIAIDANANVYVSDSSSGSVTIYNTSGTQLALISGVTSPTGIAIAPNTPNVPSALAGSIWVGCSPNICAYTPYSGTTPTAIALSTDGTLSFAQGLAFDSSGHLWVYDEVGGVISVYSIGGSATSATLSRAAVSLSLGSIDSSIGSNQLGVTAQGTGWIGGPGSLNGLYSFTESGASLNASSKFTQFGSVWSVMIAP